MPADQYNIGCYLLDRLVECGCRHFFGVPGDYNLRFLDDVMAQEKTASKPFKWIGCANELNAAYAAEAYGKANLHYSNNPSDDVKRIAALLTTFGVGEISALNGIAGAMAEHSPVLHIVGAPSTTSVARREILHHSLGEGNFDDFAKMSVPITCAQASLSVENARQEIDRVLQQIVYNRRPGFLLMPFDVADAPCNPLSAELEPLQPPVSASAVAQFRRVVEELLESSHRPALLAGYLCDRFGGSNLTHQLIQKSNIPFAVQILGKGTLNEKLPQFVGMHSGNTSSEAVKEVIEGADVVIQVGVKFHDIGCNRFTQNFDSTRTIDIQPFEAHVNGHLYSNLPMHSALEIVLEVALQHHLRWPTAHPFPQSKGIPVPSTESTKFTAYHFWSELEHHLCPGDILLTDIGTACFAGSAVILPEDALYINQFMWASIGNTLPAALGAQLACPDRRVILVIGDGAAQMTIQEIGTFLRYGLRPIIFLLNNDGYVIERVIHGWNEPYNDIEGWNYCEVVSGMTRHRADCTIVSAAGQTTQALQQAGDHNINKAANTPGKMIFREVMLGRHEAPIVELLRK